MITAIVWFLIGALIGISIFVYWAQANRDLNSMCGSWPGSADCDLLAEVASPVGVDAGSWRVDADGHLVRTLSDGRTQRGNGDITAPEVGDDQ